MSRCILCNATIDQETRGCPEHLPELLALRRQWNGTGVTRTQYQRLTQLESLVRCITVPGPEGYSHDARAAVGR